MSELDLLADRLRAALTRIRFERMPLLHAEHYSPLPWAQLTESERNQWRDHARACQEVMG